MRNLSVTYPNGFTAVRDAIFELDPGTICALVGVNGSGKSTIFKAIMGFVQPSAGEVRLCGMPVDEALKKNIVAYVPQSEDVDWNFPVLVETVVMMGRYGHMNFLRMPSRADRYKVDQALERVGMSAYRDRQIGELCGGQKKRVFLARSLAQEGRIILLDEPFTGIDVKTESRHHRPAARTARLRSPDAGLDPQSRQRAGVLRPGRADQPHRAGGRPDRRGLHPEQISSAPSAACCATSSSAAARCTTTTTPAASRC